MKLKTYDGVLHAIAENEIDTVALVEIAKVRLVAQGMKDGPVVEREIKTRITRQRKNKNGAVKHNLSQKLVCDTCGKRGFRGTTGLAAHNYRAHIAVRKADRVQTA